MKEQNKAAAATIGKLRRELERLERRCSNAHADALRPDATHSQRMRASLKEMHETERRDDAEKELAKGVEAYEVKQREAVRDALARRTPQYPQSLRDLTEVILTANLHLVEHARRVRNGSSTTARASAERVAERVVKYLQECGVVRRTTSGWVLT